MSNKRGPNNTVSVVTDLVVPLIEQQNLILWDVRFEKEGSVWFLRIILDKKEGVTVEDCENISRPLDKLLDDADPIEQSYCLEVASAGLERELTKQWHFDSCTDQKVVVRLIRPREGERDFVGNLKGLIGNEITITQGENEVSFVQSEVAYVRLYIEF